MHYFKITCGIILATGLVACSQPEPEPIMPQPIYDKHGDVIGCEGGQYQPGAGPVPCMPPPDDGCDSTSPNDPDCYPQSHRGDEPRGRGNNGQTAVAGTV